MSGESLVLRVARRITPDQSGLDTLLYEWVDEFFPALLPLFALLLVALILTLRTALRPLSAVMAYARAIGPGQVGLRLPLHGLPRELFSLVQAVNEAFDRMERSLQSQQEFLADAAHELRTPLAILSAHLHTLPDREAAKALQADVARMARLVDQLLMVARLEALKVSANDVTDLSDLVVELVQLMAPIAARRHRSLAVIGSQEPIFVRGNRDTLYQALRNLIENALRFTPEHSEVEILLESRGAVTVADRGPGIPVAKRDRLFQRFFQSDRRPGSGAGLGLTIARRIALAHQGDLEISDNPGGGTRFTLTLPLKETVHIGI
jgi:signal transduction histidine kinase